MKHSRQAPIYQIYLWKDFSSQLWKRWEHRKPLQLRLHEREKKNSWKTGKNSENIDCFGIRTSNMNVFDKKTWPTPPGTTPTAGSRKIYSLVRELKGKSPTGFWFELSNQQGILLWYCNWKGSRKDRSRFFIKHILFGDLIPKQSKFLGVFQVFEEFFFPFHPVAQKFPPLP